MKAKRGVTIRWKGGAIDYIPPGRDALVIWRDQFGTVHASGFGELEEHPKLEKAIRKVIRTLTLNRIIEP